MGGLKAGRLNQQQAIVTGGYDYEYNNRDEVLLCGRIISLGVRSIEHRNV